MPNLSSSNKSSVVGSILSNSDMISTNQISLRTSNQVFFLPNLSSNSQTQNYLLWPHLLRPKSLVLPTSSNVSISSGLKLHSKRLRFQQLWRFMKRWRWRFGLWWSRCSLDLGWEMFRRVWSPWLGGSTMCWVLTGFRCIRNPILRLTQSSFLTSSRGLILRSLCWHVERHFLICPKFIWTRKHLMN